MLILQFPTALWALSSLLLPLAIHLWRQPPRTVQIGSVRFLQSHAGRRLDDLRWRERWLLLMRLGLFALLTILLARPLWRQSPPRGSQRWILLDPTAAPAGPSLARLRTLQSNGYTTHLLVPGLPVIANPDSDSAAAAPDMWSLCREADATAPPGSTLAVFSPARLTELRGIRPTLRSKVEWVETPDLIGSEPHVWIETFRPPSGPRETPMITTGTCDASTMRFAATPPTGWKLETQADAARMTGQPSISTPWMKARAVAPLSVFILYDPDRTEEVRYLSAAFHAATENLGVSLALHVVQVGSDLTALPDSDWTFWLANAVPPAGIRARHGQWFQDAPFPTESSPGWIVPQPGTPGRAVFAPAVRLWQRGPAPEGTAFWTDGHGTPLLTRTITERGVDWRFASRFAPSWTDLSRSTVLPAWIRSLLMSDPAPDPTHDFRLATASQAAPSDTKPAFPLSPSLPMQTRDWDPHWLIWTLAALCFVTERFLSHRRPPGQAGPDAFSLQPATAIR